MSYQKNIYRETFLPEIDHRQAVWVAYNNVLNSFSMPNSTTAAENGAMVGMTRVDSDRFRYTLAILDGLLDQDKDETFKEDGVLSVVELMKPTGLNGRSSHPLGMREDYQWFTYWNKIDALLRRQEFYTSSKLPSGHL